MFSVSCKRIQNGTNTQYTLSPLYIIYSTIRNILRYNYNHYHLYCSEKSANIRCFAHWFSFEADSRLIQSNKKVKRQKHQPMNSFGSSCCMFIVCTANVDFFMLPEPTFVTILSPRSNPLKSRSTTKVLPEMVMNL